MYLQPYGLESREPNPPPLLPSSSVSEKERGYIVLLPSFLPPFLSRILATCNWKLGSQDQGSKALRLLNYFLQRNSSSQRRTGNQIQSKVLGTLQGPNI